MKYFLAHLFIILNIGFAQSHALANDQDNVRLSSLNDISLLAQRGLSDETILIFLKGKKPNFNLSAENIDKLMQSGVSENVIQHLLQQTKQPKYIPPPTVTYVTPYPNYYYTPHYNVAVGAVPHYSFTAASYTFANNRHHAVQHHRPRHGATIISHTPSHNNNHARVSVRHLNRDSQHSNIGHYNRNAQHNRAVIIHNSRGSDHSARAEGEHNRGHNAGNNISHRRTHNNVGHGNGNTHSRQHSNNHSRGHRTSHSSH